MSSWKISAEPRVIEELLTVLEAADVDAEDAGQWFSGHCLLVFSISMEDQQIRLLQVEDFLPWEHGILDDKGHPTAELNTVPGDIAARDSL